MYIVFRDNKKQLAPPRLAAVHFLGNAPILDTLKIWYYMTMMTDVNLMNPETIVFVRNDISEIKSFISFNHKHIQKKQFLHTSHTFARKKKN